MTEAPPPFSRPLRVDRLPPRPTRQTIVADAAGRAALAEAFGLLALESFEAKVEVEPKGRKGAVRVAGQLEARLTQTCGVTLVPLPAHVEARFTLSFAPVETLEAEAPELDLTLADLADPDPIVDGEIDLGWAVAEQLALAIDPFPRAPGAQFDPPPEAAEETAAPQTAPSPFSVLAGLRQKLR